MHRMIQLGDSQDVVRLQMEKFGIGNLFSLTWLDGRYETGCFFPDVSDDRFASVSCGDSVTNMKVLVRVVCGWRAGPRRA